MAKNRNLVADISEFQTSVNYKGLSDEVLFVWCRISDGATHYDRRIQQHVNGFKKAGADNYGFYWFLRPLNYSDGQAEAKQVLAWIKEYEDITKTGRPLMLDIEQFTNTSGTMRNAVQGCIDYLLNAGIKREQLWLYIDNGKYNQFNINTSGFKTIVPTYAYMDRAVNSPYWDLMPKHGQQLWQYSSTYASPNVAGNLDMSIFCNDGKPEMLYPYKGGQSTVSEKDTYLHSGRVKKIITKRDTGLYDSYALSKAKVIATIPKGTTLKVVESWFEGPKETDLSRFKVEFNGKTGWVSGNDDIVESAYWLMDKYGKKTKVKMKRDEYLYSDVALQKGKKPVKKGDVFTIEVNTTDPAGYPRLKTSFGMYLSALKSFTEWVE